MKKIFMAFVLLIIFAGASMAIIKNDTPNRSGCCSRHGGVCGCSGGQAKCCDGALSPSCRC